jgi:hypothetical protein
MFDDHVTAARADLEFYVPVGQTRADLTKVREEYDRTIGQMSTATLRQQAAEERLNRALASGTVNSQQVVRATLAYRREMEQLEGQTVRTGSAFAREERQVSHFSRGLLAGTGVLGGFRRAIFFASSSLLGGFGLTYAIRSTVTAVEEQQVALGHIETALADTGKGWGQYRDQIKAALDEQVRSTGFTDNELAESLAGFIRRYGDVNQALQANAIAADVARAKNVSLADAQTLVMRAGFGNPRSLRILGIELQKTTSNYDALIARDKQATKAEKDAAKAADLQATELSALDAVNAKYHGNAARFLQTTAGKQALFNAELVHTKELVGTALLPTINHLLGSLTSWLSKSKNQQTIQRDVNGIIRAGRTEVHLFANAAHNGAMLLEPLNRLLGGTRRSVELLTLAFIAFKTRGAAAFAIGVGEAEAAAAAAAGAGAVAAGSVVARVAAYTGAGAGVAAATRGGSLLAGGGGLLSRIGTYGFAFASVQPQTQHLGGPLDVSVTPLDKHNDFITYRDPVTDQLQTLDVSTGTNIADAIHADLNKRYPQLFAKGAPSVRRGLDFPGRQFCGAPSPSRSGKARPPRFTDVIPAGLQLALHKAELDGTIPDQRAALAEEQAFLEQQLKLAHTQAQQDDIVQQLLGIKSERDALTSGQTRSAHKRQTLAERRASAAFRGLESKLRANEDRAAAADTRTSRRTGITTHAAEIRADRREETDLKAFIRDHHNDLKLRQEANSRLAQLEKHLAAIEKNTSKDVFAKQAQAFLEELSGDIQRYAPNIQQDFHYDRPPQDPHAAHKHQRKAAAAAFGGG